MPTRGAILGTSPGHGETKPQSLMTARVDTDSSHPTECHAADGHLYSHRIRHAHLTATAKVIATHKPLLITLAGCYIVFYRDAALHLHNASPAL